MAPFLFNLSSSSSSHIRGGPFFNSERPIDHPAAGKNEHLAREGMEEGEKK